MKRGGRSDLSPFVGRKEAISNRSVRRMYRFNFHFHLAPSNFPRVLSPFPFEWVHTRVNDFIWQQRDDAVLRTTFGFSLEDEKTARNRRRRASASALEDAGQSSDGAARLGKLINLFIRRINIVTALRLARAVAAAATSPPHLSYRSAGRPSPSLLHAERTLAAGDFDSRKLPSFANAEAMERVNR